MYLFIFIILLLLVLIIALFTEHADVSFALNTDNTEFFITVSWLFISVSVYNKGMNPELSVYLLKWRITTKPIHLRKKRKKGNSAMVKNLIFEQAYGRVSYGFSSPFFTGISLGFFPAFQALISSIRFQMTPDFFSDHNYLIVNGNAKINLGKTAINFFRGKNKRRKIYGSAEYH